MSKAKELARKISEYIVRRHTSFYFGGVRNELHELLDLVLSEPDNPDELKGWIEIGEKPNRQLVSTTHDKVISEGVVPFDYVNKGDPCVGIHKLGESIDAGLRLLKTYEEIKQKIKESL